jgi:alcohol dehydrogenase
LPHPDKLLSIPPVNLVGEERTLKGSYIGSSVPARDIPRYISLFQQGFLPIDKLMSHRLRLSEINAGFDRLADGQAVRQVIEF